jgi:Zn-dependent protease with chaperone function
MDFFAHQDRARRNSWWLLIHFLLAVLLITLAVYATTVVLFFGIEVKAEQDIGINPWNLEYYLWVAAITLTIIATGTLYKILVLSRGGEVVARTLGARPVEPNTTDLAERRLLNVVEEMAIASGVPVPSVYLLDKENSINAFAAGFTPTDAVVAVTRGTLELLSRDELQGVIAHEFSHILNGDMRLNIRLMGVLHGILVIALIGYSILRGIRVSSREKGGGLIILLFGAALVAIGFVGVFFAKIIKSAVSRQREFLADS